MEKPIGDPRGQKPTVSAKEEIADADHPLLRLLTVPRVKKAADISRAFHHPNDSTPQTAGRR